MLKVLRSGAKIKKWFVAFVKKKCVTFRRWCNLDWIRVEIKHICLSWHSKLVGLLISKKKRSFSLFDLSALMVCFFNGKNWKQIVNRAKHDDSRTSDRRYFIWLLNDLASSKLHLQIGKNPSEKQAQVRIQ